MRFVCILSTAPDIVSARKLAVSLTSSKLAACVALIPGIESHYFWKGKKEESREVQIIIKTASKFLKKIESFLKKHHPYDVPEFIVLSASASKKYSSWMKSSLLKD